MNGLVKQVDVAESSGDDATAARELSLLAESVGVDTAGPGPRTGRVTATGPKRAPRRVAIGVALTCVALLSAGCGGSHPSTPAVGSSATFSAAAVKYTNCMRDHGVSNFPNPTMTDHNGQQVTYLAPPNSVLSSPAYRNASKTCAGILPLPVTPRNAEAQQ